MSKEDVASNGRWVMIFGGFTLLALVLTLIGVYTTFFVVPVISDVEGLAQIGFSQKIFYFHLGAAITSVSAFTTAFVASILYLVKQKEKYDVLAHTAVEVGLIFAFALMAMGMSWDKAAWGRWWIWDPRLTTYLVLILVYAAYTVLRRSIEGEDKKANFAAAFGIIAYITVPLTLLSTRIIPRSIHPKIVGISGMGTDMITALVVAILAMHCLLIAILILRGHMEALTEEINVLKDKMEEG